MPALYRIYRSKSLAEVVGQEHITQTLANAIANGHISHAYLFTGPRGVGKTSVARIVAHEINGLPYSENGHIDIIEIDAASNRRIDDVRDLRDKVHIAPVSAKYKVYIIDEVHMLTGEAFNALLKTLEEPPAHVVFILATTEVHKLPATIISRSQRYNFRTVPAEKVVAHLRHIAQAEKISVDDEALQLIAEHGEGSFRDSISLLDQLASAGEPINAATVEQTLGLAPRAALQQLVNALQTKDQRRIIDQLAELTRQGTTSATLVPQLLRALQTVGLYELLDELLEVPRAYNPEVKLLTTLLKHTLPSPELSRIPDPDPEPIPEPAADPAAYEAEPIDISAEGPIEPTDTPAEPTPSAQVSPTPTPASGTLDPAAWDSVLQAVGQASPPLQSILKHAHTDFDATSAILTLTFQYKLHSNRIDEIKAKSLIAKILSEILGTSIQLQVTLDTGRPAPSAQLNPIAQSVADLMGGGEAVSI